MKELVANLKWEKKAQKIEENMHAESLVGDSSSKEKRYIMINHGN